MAVLRVRNLVSDSVGRKGSYIMLGTFNDSLSLQVIMFRMRGRL